MSYEQPIKIGTLAGGTGAVDYIRQILPHGFESFELTWGWGKSACDLDLPKLAAELHTLLAGKAVIVTYFSHYSLKNWIRRLRKPFNRKGDKHTLSTGRVVELARQAGFTPARIAPLSRLSSGHVFALLVRAG